MDKSRRKFLKIAGAGALLLGSKPVADAVAKSPIPKGKVPISEESDTRYAMVIDTRKCREQSDCQDCVHACHLEHNVPDFEDKQHEIKWIWKSTYEKVLPNQQREFTNEQLHERPFLSLCNHCSDPPCVRVCPTQATFKRGDGIVVMDMHRCIGCRFCIAACPYGSRSFNWTEPRLQLEKTGQKINKEFPLRTRGVVEKCNFCAERLADGKQPACVLACKHGALFFGNILDPNSTVRKLLEANYAVRRKPALGTNPQVYYIL